MYFFFSKKNVNTPKIEQHFLYTKINFYMLIKKNNQTKLYKILHIIKLQNHNRNRGNKVYL